MASEDAVDSMDVDELARLEAAARKRWGDGGWSIDITLWTNGEFQAFAFRSLGLVDPNAENGVYKRDRLAIDVNDEEYVVRREHYRQEDVDIVDEEIGDLEDVGE